MAFSILDHLETLEKSDAPGKYICPACGGNDLSINLKNGAYTCWHDPTSAHRAEIRDALAPLTRWEKPPRRAGEFHFSYFDNSGQKVVTVHRKDEDNGKKRIWQDFPTIDPEERNHKIALQEVKANVLPYKYNEAIKEHKKNGTPIFIVEGESTCESLWAIGIPSVTFLGGSKQYRTNADYSGLFRDYQVVLAPDRDEQGVAFMAEVANDNPGAGWVYADPRSWEWDNLPSGNGYDLGDYVEEGATKEEILSSIVSKNRHSGKNGKPSYEEIINTIENFIGLHNNDSRINYETANWLEQHGVKMAQANIDKIVEEAKTRIYGREEIETIDALSIASSDKARDWLIAGIMPLGTVMLFAASGGSGKSTIAYNWALHIALGQSWSGRHCLKGKSLIIQSDEPLVDASEKLTVIGYQDADLEPNTINFWETWRFAHMKQLEDYVKKHRPLFIAIDSLTACLAGMDVDLIKSNAGDVIYGLRDIANTYKCSIMILHHLNKSGGLRDSSSFVDNVSEVVKLYRPDNNFDPNEFHVEWLKSRSGLTGKHVLQRDPLNYGWRYAGPLGASLEDLDNVVKVVNMRKNERLTKRQVASSSATFDISGTGKMLEVARRQGLILSQFVDGPNGEKERVYHSWDYEEPNLTFEPAKTEKEPEDPDDYF